MATIRDIADAAGVSRCTASQVLNRAKGYQRFTTEVRERILVEAERLGWVPDHRANALKTGLTGTLALGITWAEDASSIQQAFLTEIELAVRSRGQHLLIVGGGPVSAMRLLNERRCDGVLAIGWHLRDAADVLALRSCNHAVAFYVPKGLRGVALDPSPAFADLTCHLLGLGHRRLAYIGPVASPDGRRRVQAVRRACREAGASLLVVPCDEQVTMREDERIAIADAAIRAHLDALRGCTGLVCYCDITAFAVYRIAYQHGIRIPSDWSVTGFDDIQARYLVPALTTASHELRAVAQGIVALVLDRDAANPDPRHPRLVLRDSTAPPRSPG